MEGSRGQWIVERALKSGCQDGVSLCAVFLRIYPVLKRCFCFWLYLGKCFCPPESYSSDAEAHATLVCVTQTQFSLQSISLLLQHSYLSSFLLFELHLTTFSSARSVSFLVGRFLMLNSQWCEHWISLLAVPSQTGYHSGPILGGERSFFLLLSPLPCSYFCLSPFS